MEITEENTVWLNPSHPNYERWRKGRELKSERAVIAGKIISAHKVCTNLDILDLGSGEGGTSSYFSGNNNVISYDLSLFRLKRQRHTDNKFKIVNGNAQFLPFRNSFFDLIILQDAIEHININGSLISELKRVIKDDGLIYISTPNRHSILNIISDPHWGIPFLSLFRRNSIKKYFLRLFRKEDLCRDDIAELLSLKELFGLFKHFRIILNTKEIIGLLSESYNGILWSNFHTTLLNLLNKSGLIFILKALANNKTGFINNYLTPTFYLILIPPLTIKATNE
jgi:SAM-dependent methyltransferase